MPELSALSPVSQEEHAPSTCVEGMRSRQGNGSRTYANFSSAITSMRMHQRGSLLAISAIGLGAMLVMAMAILVQGANTLHVTHVYTRVMTILLVSIGGGAFAGGGLIMMNILLAEGMERAREFGIRLVVGARRRDIRDQFLFEALLLSLIGGVSGSGWGLLIGFLLTSLFQLPFIVDPMLTALLVSASVVPGIVGGLHPALKISHLNFERVLHVVSSNV